jgi:hypothetical protein
MAFQGCHDMLVAVITLIKQSVPKVDKKVYNDNPQKIEKKIRRISL